MEQGRSTSLRLSNKKEKLIPRDIYESLGKLPPQALDMEESVLGALMLERDALNEVIEFLKPDDFYSDVFQEVYRAILDLFNDSKPVDMRTVVNRLRKNGKIELIGGAHTIAELTSKVSSSANIETHARVVVEMSIKRKLILAASEIHHLAYEDTEDVFSLLDSTQQRIDEIAGSQLTVMQKADIVLNDSLKRIGELRNETGITGVQSGWMALDKATGGWQIGLIIIAARPGMGKTGFAVGCVLNAAIRFKLPVLIFSLEMSGQQIMFRMIAHESEVDLDRIIKGQISDTELEKINEKTKEIKESPIWIDDKVALYYLELRAKVRRAVAKFGIQLIVIDYLQLMRGDQGGNREQEIASISAALKNLSKEVKRPIIALSQLTRDVEKRGGDKRPQLSDLRESGSLEQDANMVAFLYRPEYYNIKDYDNGESTKGVMEVILAKYRDGPIGKVRLNFENKFVKITDTPPKTKIEQNIIPFEPTYYQDKKQPTITTDDPPF